MQRLPKLLEAGANVLFALTLTLTLLAAVILPLAALLHREVPVPVPVSFVPTHAAIALPGQSAVDVGTSTSLVPLNVASSLPLILVILGGLATVAVPAAWALHLIGRVLANVAEGRALSSVNADRLRWVGVLVIVAELGWALAALILQDLLARDAHAVAMTIAPRFDLNGLVLLGAGVILMISMVWRQAADLQADADLTV